MNKELKEWLKESKQTEEKPVKKTKKQVKKTDEKPQGPCQICGVKNAKARCIACDKTVCSDCYFHLVSLCKKCVSKNTGDKWKQYNPDWEKKLGVEWIE